jgi:hypothetical protein
VVCAQMLVAMYAYYQIQEVGTRRVAQGSPQMVLLGPKWDPVQL